MRCPICGCFLIPKNTEYYHPTLGYKCINAGKTIPYPQL